MNILDAVVGAHGGGAVQQLANQFGLQRNQAESALSVLVPALAAGLQRNMSSEAGLSSLTNALGQGGHETYIDQPDTLARAETTADGNAILGHVLGSKDASRAVAARAAQQTGIAASILKKMLPLVATLVMGGLARQSRSSGGVNAGGLMSMLGPLLDRDRDGSIIDDVGGMVGGMLGRKR